MLDMFLPQSDRVLFPSVLVEMINTRLTIKNIFYSLDKDVTPSTGVTSLRETAGRVQ